MNVKGGTSSQQADHVNSARLKNLEAARKALALKRLSSQDSAASQQTTPQNVTVTQDTGTRFKTHAFDVIELENVEEEEEDERVQRRRRPTTQDKVAPSIYGSLSELGSNIAWSIGRVLACSALYLGAQLALRYAVDNGVISEDTASPIPDRHRTTSKQSLSHEFVPGQSIFY